MPTPQTKIIGHTLHINLDPVGADVDLSADVTDIDLGGLERIMLDANTVGYDVTRQVHGAFNFPVSMTLQPRINFGIQALFANYFQGNPPFWISFEFWDAKAAVSANNQKLHLMDGTVGNAAIAAIAWNSITPITLNFMFDRIALNDADDAAGVSIKDGSTVDTHIADAAPS